MVLPSNVAETAAESSAIPQWAFHHHDSLEWSRRDSLEHSRHRTDFESLRFLGRGAFGVCRKVKNRVDHHVYCLKSILISSSNDTDYILREAQVLSSLPSHANVVRYYGAFVERLEVQQQEELLVGDVGTSSSWEGDWTPTTATQDQESAKNDPVCHLCQSSYKDWEVSFEHWGLIDAVLQPHDLCIPCYTKSIPPNTIDKISIRQQAVLHDYLFILMEFCEFTLPEALVDAGDMTIWNYFGQVVQGVAHLHAQGVIHRDIKPPNIFVHQGIVKIGDLGLASAGISVSSTESTTSSSQASHSSQVGTVLYTAPEVSTGHYNQACDVFSLGVVLVELWSTPFSTAMERVDVLSRLKHGELPNVHPIAASLARAMVATDPTQRPSCLEILETLTNAGVWNGLQSSESQSVSKLQAELIKSQQETLRLRKLLDQHNIPY